MSAYSADAYLESARTACEDYNLTRLLEVHHAWTTRYGQDFTAVVRLEHWLDEARHQTAMARKSQSLRLFLYNLVLATKFSRDLMRLQPDSRGYPGSRDPVSEGRRYLDDKGERRLWALCEFYCRLRTLVPPLHRARLPVRLGDIHRAHAQLTARVFYDRLVYSVVNYARYHLRPDRPHRPRAGGSICSDTGLGPAPPAAYRVELS